MFLRDGDSVRFGQQSPLWPASERPSLCVDRSQAKLLFGQAWIEFLQFVHRGLFFYQTGNVIARDSGALNDWSPRENLGVFHDHFLCALQLFEAGVYLVPKLLNSNLNRSRLL